jgi:hypothetical protein
MNNLFVAWQQPGSGEWIPVASLERYDHGYRFFYTQGVLRAKNFRPVGGMDKLDFVYESTTLFPLFSNRIIGKSRPEFKDYLRWLGLDSMGNDPMAMLSLTGGIRGTDSIELFQPPSLDNDGQYSVDFFVRSLLHLSKNTIEHIVTLEPNSKLFFMKDCQNSFDPMALALRSDAPPVLVGYCPKYYTKDLGILLSNIESELQVRVKCINKDAPLNMRLLCSISAKAPKDFLPLGNENDFLPFNGSVPSDWNALSDELNRI